MALGYLPSYSTICRSCGAPMGALRTSYLDRLRTQRYLAALCGATYPSGSFSILAERSEISNKERSQPTNSWLYCNYRHSPSACISSQRSSYPHCQSGTNSPCSITDCKTIRDNSCTDRRFMGNRRLGHPRYSFCVGREVPDLTD